MEDSNKTTFKEKIKEVIEFFKLKEEYYEEDDNIIEFKSNNAIMRKMESFVEKLHYN